MIAQLRTTPATIAWQITQVDQGQVQQARRIVRYAGTTGAYRGPALSFVPRGEPSHRQRFNTIGMIGTTILKIAGDAAMPGTGATLSIGLVTNSSSIPAEEWFWIHGSLPGGYGLNYPLLIHIFAEGDELVADAPSLGVYAFGADRAGAIENLKHRMVDRREHLTQLAGRLAPAMAVDADRLNSAVGRRSV